MPTYVWNRPVGGEYHETCVVAVADSAEEAREQLANQCYTIDELPNPSGVMLRDTFDRMVADEEPDEVLNTGDSYRGGA